MTPRVRGTRPDLAGPVFRAALGATGAAGRDCGRWIFVPYDQISDRIGPLEASDPAEAGIVLIESEGWLRRRPWHRQKLALVLANQRRFALEQAMKGRAVRYLFTEGTFREALESFAAGEGPLAMAEAAERELRCELAPLVADGRIEESPHTGWLTEDADFGESQPPAGPWRMDRFYRHVRRRSGLMMTDGRPEGGRYSCDAENRLAWNGEPPPPSPPRFRPCDIVREVAREIDLRFGDHPGRVDAASLPASRSQIDRLWAWALDACLPAFGPYEDAMSTRCTGLFHTRISAVLNLHRLLPSRVVEDVARAKVPLASREGFVRQVLGWREFVRHVHHRTDGFRCLPGGGPLPVRPAPGDGGCSSWAGAAWPTASPAPGGDGGVAPGIGGSASGVPAAWWGARSGLNCLETVVASVWEEGYSHHIPRLMILSNLANLLDVSPRDLTDWFWGAYTDAYDWVVEPNVLGMGMFAIGDLMTTKPCISDAGYISRMSDYCAGCAFNPRTDCPITRLYWAWIDRHRDRIEKNPRMAMPLRSLRRRAERERRIDVRTRDWVRAVLAEGRVLAPPEPPATVAVCGGQSR